MELKPYQREVISDLDCFMEQLREDQYLHTAFSNYWAKKGISLASSTNKYLRPYDNSVKNVPHVTVKVPTAGGKTFIACNALRTIFDKMPSTSPKVVAWFVPSDTILKQTYKNLSNPLHPYRQKIDSHFGHAVQVVDKEAALNGHGIKPAEIAENLTIFVLSVQSFASNRKDRRSYLENENLAEYPKLYDALTKRVDGSDETGLIQVLSYLNPVVIIDESHNFEAALRVEMLQDINPRFILDLTATPRNKSNIISFVDAIKLKKENMVKLPVIVYNHRSREEVVSSAIQLQKSLEERAIQQEVTGGQYIRPIVLFQAESNTSDEKVTFDKLKDKLIKIGIPESQIKIKTANIDDIKHLDLLDRDCPVRYIITVNALKEGWDCPFAYILASLASKSSRVDVEQILGRVLRQPYAMKQQEDLLNLSYVFTSSSNFRETIDNIIEGLNRAGFSKRDYRAQESIISTVPEANTPPQLPFPTEPAPTPMPTEDSEEEIDAEAVKEMVNKENQLISSLTAFAQQESEDFNKNIEAFEHEPNQLPHDIKDMVADYRIKECFREAASAIRLPMFSKKVKHTSFWEEEQSYIRLDKAMLADGFELDKQDHNVDFTPVDAEAVSVDITKEGEEYRPVRMDMKAEQLAYFKKHFDSLAPESQKKMLMDVIVANLSKSDLISQTQIKQYVNDVIKGFSVSQIADLYATESQTITAFKKKIRGLLETYQKKRFEELLDIGDITCSTDWYALPESIGPLKTLKGLANGLYEEEGDVNDFEYKVINAVSALKSVLFWHRNPERGVGFCINGYINHYPDFIVRMKSGITILLETKGDDRDNSDSKEKLELGKIWASKAGEQYRYFMVFENRTMEGAINAKELIERLTNM
ncbi:MAG: DEAD/DEAH box helicase family protein [Bacteroides sp.]|nr:DEAD/DEAH box helicase family protein [Bacteroides sp.]